MKWKIAFISQHKSVKSAIIAILTRGGINRNTLRRCTPETVTDDNFSCEIEDNQELRKSIREFLGRILVFYNVDIEYGVYNPEGRL